MQLAIAGGVAAAIAVIIIVALVIRRKMGGRSVPPGLQPGQPLPAFTALDESGRELQSSDLRGRPTVILFVRGS